MKFQDTVTKITAVVVTLKKQNKNTASSDQCNPGLKLRNYTTVPAFAVAFTLLHKVFR
jgi:hypothetical protein